MTTVMLRPRLRQRGMVSMLVTFVFLVIAGIVMLYTSRSAIVETRLSANEIRSKQAFAAAQAGIDYAIAYANSGGFDQNGNGTVDSLESSVFGTAGSLLFELPNNAAFRVAYCTSNSALSPTSSTPVCADDRNGTFPPAGCTAPTVFTGARIVACGWSDDDASRHIAMVNVRNAPATPDGDVTVPLITRGAANFLTGGASVLNYFNDLTTWTGGSFDGASMTGKTFVRNTSLSDHVEARIVDSNDNGEYDYRETGNSPTCNNAPDGYTCSTQGSKTGHDIVYGDTNLSTLSPDQFFQLFFGMAPTTYRDTTASYLVDLNNSLTGENSTSASSLSGKNALSIWVAGNLTTPANTTIGTPTNPVVLIVDGNLTLSSSTVINGLVYVSGNVDASGNPEIYGALIVAGSTNTTGNPLVIYDPNVLKGANPTGRSAELPGSWQDWTD